MDIGLTILVTIVLILCNSFFSAAEMSLVKVRQIPLQHEAEEGDRKAQRALELAQDSDGMLAANQVGMTLVGFFASAAAATNLSDPLAAWVGSIGGDGAYAVARVLAPIVITLLVSYVTIVVGELFPKRLGLSNPEGIAKATAGPLRVFIKVASPLVKLTAASSNGLAKLLGVKDPEDANDMSEEEIRYMVEDNDELDDDEKRMIGEVMELDESNASDIMQPRVDMITAEDTETVRQVIDRMNGTGYTRLPVFHETPDRIVGIVNFKDLIKPLLEDEDDLPVTDFMTEPFFVPETKDLMPLLNEMQTKRQQMAIVVDEYGGTAGLITTEDIVEEIVGEIIDESDHEAIKHYTVLSENEWVAEGMLDCEDAIELGWPIEESEEYDTLAGWLMDALDCVPAVGEELEKDGFVFKVAQMRRRRISMVRVKRVGEAVTEQPEED